MKNKHVLVIATTQQAALTFARFGLPAIALYLREAFGLSLVQIGLVIGSFNLGAFATFYITGRATDNFGEKSVMLVGSTIVALIYASLFFANTWQEIALGLVVAGFGFPSSQIAGSRVVYRAFSAKNRGFAMGVRQAGLPLGGLIAAAVLPLLIIHWQWRSSFVASSLVAMAGALFCLMLPNGKSSKNDKQVSSVKHFFKRSDLLLVTLVATLLAFSQFCVMSYLPLYLVDKFHTNKSIAALSLISLQIGGVAGRIIWGYISDNWPGKDRTITLCIVGLIGSFTAISLCIKSLIIIFIISLIAGASFLGWNGLYVTSLNDRIKKNAATILGLSMMSLYLVAMIAPPIFGQIIESLGYRFAWMTLIIPQIIAAFIAWSI